MGRASVELNRLVFYSLLTGLTRLIPVPFLDDWARDFLRRSLVADIVHGRTARLGEEELQILACGEPPGGRLRGCFLATLWRAAVLVGKKLLRKVFRTILFFLAVKDCVRTFARTFHEGYLLRHAVSLGELGETPPGVGRVREAIEASLCRLDLGPIERLARRTLAGSWKTLRRSARGLGRWLQGLRRGGEGEGGNGEIEAQEEILRPLVDELTVGLRHESGYLSRLERLFEAELRRLGESVPPPGGWRPGGA